MLGSVTALRLVAGSFLILANGFFVAVEFALTRIRRYSESEFDEPGLRRPWETTERLETYHTSRQVGTTASSIAVGTAAEPMTLSADTTVSDAIDRFQIQKQELALVLEAGEVVGLVTPRTPSRP